MSLQGLDTRMNCSKFNKSRIKVLVNLGVSPVGAKENGVV